jgi:hypothetical protein
LSPTGGGFAHGANRFSDEAGATPGGGPNPYQSPATSGVTREETLLMVRNKVRGPAIALIIIGSLNVLWLGLFVFAFIVQAFDDGVDEEDLLMVAVYLPVLLLKSVPVLYGGLQMMKLRNYWAAMTASIIAIVPCCCFVIELPLAIWALVVLFDYHVRMVFRQGPAAFQQTRSPF